MSTHTPGPWVLNGVMAMDTRLWIVSIPGEQARIEVADYSAESEANAHLIAAAPKLLAALERLADNTEGRNLRGQTQETALRQAISEARAAIAEVRGGK